MKNPLRGYREKDIGYKKLDTTYIDLTEFTGVILTRGNLDNLIYERRIEKGKFRETYEHKPEELERLRSNYES